VLNHRRSELSLLRSQCPSREPALCPTGKHSPLSRIYTPLEAENQLGHVSFRYEVRHERFQYHTGFP